MVVVGEYESEGAEMCIPFSLYRKGRPAGGE